jgi:hypothetical protein
MTILVYEAQPSATQPPVRWAECASGPIGPVGAATRLTPAMLVKSPSKRHVLTFELPDIERSDLEVLVKAVLRRSLKAPSSLSGEAILYLAVNESIHKLQEIVAHEKL